MILVSAVMSSASCSGKVSSTSAEQNIEETVAESPGNMFSADSSFSYVKAQVDFGPRTPGSEAHDACARWIASELKRHGADTVMVQRGEVVEPVSGSKLPVSNIMGRYNPQAIDRLMLVAHYDTRPWADEENNPDLHNTPIDGANDGGSGVGVMLELARQLGIESPEIGVDFLFVDAEDSGTSGDHPDANLSWALGSQYWVENTDYSRLALQPRLVIVLDMVGGINARFHREQFSTAYYPAQVNRVWAIARQAGYGDRFVNEPGGPILDDHLPFIRKGIPAIDIVESKSSATGSFPATWHTLSDNIQNISPESLKAVGATMLHFIRAGF